jgi:hypothetical protein
MESLLHLHEQQTELWDISNPVYSKRDARQRALERLKDALGILLLVGFDIYFLIICVLFLWVVFLNLIFLVFYWEFQFYIYKTVNIIKSTLAFEKKQFHAYYVYKQTSNQGNLINSYNIKQHEIV